MAMTQGKFQAKDKSTEKLKDFNGEGTYSYGMFKYQGMFKDGGFDGASGAKAFRDSGVAEIGVKH